MISFIGDKEKYYCDDHNFPMGWDMSQHNMQWDKKAMENEHKRVENDDKDRHVHTDL